jgi:hypothetical protein
MQVGYSNAPGYSKSSVRNWVAAMGWSRARRGHDERSALRWLVRSAGAACQVVYLPVDKDVQPARA